MTGGTVGKVAPHMRETYKLPIQESVRDVFMSLLGRGVAVTREKSALPHAETAVVADYVDDDGQVVALAVCDAGFANRVGAALALVPNRVADEFTRDREVPPHLLENVQEVLNVSARLINATQSRHVRLGAVHTDLTSLPDPMSELLVGPDARRDYGVTVEGYGPGRLALIVR